MQLGKIKLYPLSLLASVVSLYLIATDMHGWYIYVLLGFVFLERAFLQAALLIIARMQARVQKAVMAGLQQAAQSGAFGTGGPFDQENE